jgi:hypothetical protein
MKSPVDETSGEPTGRFRPVLSHPGPASLAFGGMALVPFRGMRDDWKSRAGISSREISGIRLDDFGEPTPNGTGVPHVTDYTPKVMQRPGPTRRIWVPCGQFTENSAREDEKLRPASRMV